MNFHSSFHSMVGKTSDAPVSFVASSKFSLTWPKTHLMGLTIAKLFDGWWAAEGEDVRILMVGLLKVFFFSVLFVYFGN